MTPSTDSSGVQSTWSAPISRAIGSTWKRVAEDASTTVWPLRRCASISSHISWCSRLAISCLKSDRPSCSMSSSVLPAQARERDLEERAEVVRVVDPARVDASSVLTSSSGPISIRRNRWR